MDSVAPRGELGNGSLSWRGRRQLARTTAPGNTHLPIRKAQDEHIRCNFNPSGGAGLSFLHAFSLQ